MKPKRIQRKRTKGWRMPENTIYVGRPSVYGNPYETAEEYKKFLDDMNIILQDIIKFNLRGKNLACWCSLEKKCHADILLKFSND